MQLHTWLATAVNNLLILVAGPHTTHTCTARIDVVKSIDITLTTVWSKQITMYMKEICVSKFLGEIQHGRWMINARISEYFKDEPACVNGELFLECPPKLS